MMMPADGDQTTQGEGATDSGRGRNGPIWVIGALLGVTDAGLAYVGGATDGGIQIAVLAFLGLYTCALAGMFFCILWDRPWVLYPPSEYGSTNVRDFGAAMQGDPVRAERLASEVGNELSIQGALGQSLSEATIGLDPVQRKAVLDVAERTRTAVVDRIRNAVVYVDPSPLKGEGSGKWELAYDPEMAFSQFADQVFWRLQPFPPYAYGTNWALREGASGVVFALAQGSVRDAGIRGGMALEVIDPRGGGDAAGMSTTASARSLTVRTRR